MIDNQIESIKSIQNRLETQSSAIFSAYYQQQACEFAQPYFSFSSLPISPTIIFNDLYIPASCRQKGIAAHLMQYAKNLPVMVATVAFHYAPPVTITRQEPYIYRWDIKLLINLFIIFLSLK
jgi:hypothetical protein